MNAGLGRLAALLMLLGALASSARGRGSKMRVREPGRSGGEIRFIQNELRSVRMRILKTIPEASCVGPSEILRLLEKVGNLQGRHYGYYRAWWDLYYAGRGGFMKWLSYVPGSVRVRSCGLNRRVAAVVNASEKLGSAIKKRYSNSGAFQEGEPIPDQDEHDKYFHDAMEGNRRFRELRETCLDVIAGGICEGYPNRNIFEGEVYGRSTHRCLYKGIVGRLGQHMRRFAGGGEDCEGLIEEMVDIEAEYYGRDLE